MARGQKNESQTEVQTVGNPIESMQVLRKVLKTAKTGTGDVAKAIESCNFSLTERGFTMLIVTCRRSGKWKKAMEIFAAMSGPLISSRGVTPNFYTYSSLLSVCCNAGACSKALQVFEEMEAAASMKPDMKPDSEVYSTLVCALWRGKRPKDAVRICHEAHGKGLSLDMRAVAAAGESMVELGMVGEAINMVDDYHGVGRVLPENVYITLLKACSNEINLDSSVEIFLMMQMVEVGVSQAACYEVMKTACSANDVGACRTLLLEMKENGMEVDGATYGCFQDSMREAVLE